MQFSLWRPKIYTCSPVGADITKLIPDPDILGAILMQNYSTRSWWIQDNNIIAILALHAMLAL